MTTQNIEIRNRVRGGKVFFAGKLPGKKDAFRADNIPENLACNVSVSTEDDGSGIVTILCVEGIQHVPFANGDELHNIVVAWEESESEVKTEDGEAIKTGYNAWHKANAATTLVEIDGVFYANKVNVVKMQLITDSEEVPELVSGAEVSRNGDAWVIKTDWGESSGKPNEAIWVRYGTKESGVPDANILTMTEKSFAQYYVCTEDGEMLFKLSEAFEA